jgi:hypothetical protein
MSVKELRARVASHLMQPDDQDKAFRGADEKGAGSGYKCLSGELDWYAAG